LKLRDIMDGRGRKKNLGTLKGSLKEGESD